MLAGYIENQFELDGPDQITARYVGQTDFRALIESRLRHQLSSYYRIPSEDLAVSIDRQFDDESLANLGFASMQLGPTQPVELSPGKQNIEIVIRDAYDREIFAKIPVTIAVVREMVVARTNIARGETLNPQNIEAIRRPISDRNIRLTSYQQAIGQLVQTDIPRYGLIKPNLIRTAVRAPGTPSKETTAST